MQSFLYRNEKLIQEFKYPIRCMLDLENKYIIVLEIPTGVQINDNVYCINKDGRLLWQIEQRYYEGESPSYHNVWITSEGLFAYRPNYEYKIDIATGKILSVDFLK